MKSAMRWAFGMGVTAALLCAVGAPAQVAGQGFAGAVAPGVGENQFSRDGVWMSLAGFPAEVANATPWIRPNVYHAVALDIPALRAVLAAAPMENTHEADIAPIIVIVPTPEGSFARFRVVESPIMTPDFALARPDIKTYAGQGVDDKIATIRFDLTPEGFHGQVLSPGKSYWIDPFTKGDTTYYTSYRKRDLTNTAGWQCFADGEPVDVGQGSPFTPRAIVTRREYRTAITGTGEYTTFHGGVVAAQAATVTSVNRINQVYEQEFAVRLVMINNAPIIYASAATDPFTGTVPGTLINENQTNTTAVIGSANYDIGHIYSAANGGGVAQLGSVCGANKARGVSTFPSPVNDPFNIDYVAHEMGHQFNAPHTFAGCGGGSGSTSYEPGSASTIMGYAGICGADNLQANSDPFFHHASIQTIATFVASGAGNGCDIPVVTTNNTPTVTHPATSYTVPPSTPFFLTATGLGDVDGDTVTYLWEQRNALAVALGTVDTGTNPLFRSRTPTTSPTQSFPSFADVLDGSLDAGDIWPTTNRTLAFRVTARDNHANGSGVTIPTTNYSVTVNTTGGAFSVTAPNTNVLITTNTTTVTWNPGSTAGAPFNAANVQILLSTDGGTTFPTILASSTPNDGTEVVTLPVVTSTTCRIMVQAINNIFYDVSNVNFRLTITGAPPSAPAGVIATPATSCPSQSVQLSATPVAGETVYWYTTGCGTGFFSLANPVNVNPSSTTTYFARTRRNSDSVFSTGCTPVTVTVDPNPVTPTGASVDRPGVCAGDGVISLSATGGSGTTLRWFDASCGVSPVGVGSPLVLAAPSTPKTYFARWETTCGNSVCASVSVSILPGPVAPSTALVDRPSVCAGDGVVSLSAVGGSGTTLRWFDDACGGTSIGTGSPLVIAAPTAPTTYRARWENSCGNSLCASVSVAVTTLDIDFNNDGVSPDTIDLDDLLSAFGGGACSNDPLCDSIDFNGDGVSPDTLDLEAFIAAYGGGGC